jgi:serine phosphatase RsbU (regulator of sigma subunit)
MSERPRGRSPGAAVRHDGIAAAYREALASYVRAPDERGRALAYALGHRAVEDEIGLLELVGIHRAAVVDVVGPDPTRDLLVAAIDFLSESLSTFEMAQRGYREAQERAAIAHDIALTLQRSLLPAELPVPPGLDLAVRYLPAGRRVEVGGDWYDVVSLGADRAALVVGDVMGHGIRQASVMGQMRMGLRAYLLEDHPLDDVARRTDALLQSVGGLQTATVVLVVVDLGRPAFRLVNAGHPPPVLIDASGRATQVTAGHGRLLGLGGDAEWPIHGPEAISDGTTILLYTDGLLEASERAGRDPFADLLASVDGFSGSPDDLCDRVTGAMVDDEPGDDICLLAARVVGAGPGG